MVGCNPLVADVVGLLCVDVDTIYVTMKRNRWRVSHGVSGG